MKNLYISRKISVLMLACFITCSLAPLSGHADHADASYPVVVSADINDYSSGEILVLYGSDDSVSACTYTFSDSSEFDELLCRFRADSSVLAVQPNYTYSVASNTIYDTITDTSFSKQWALNNDGSFSETVAESDYSYNRYFDDIFMGNFTAPEYYYDYYDNINYWTDWIENGSRFNYDTGYYGDINRYFNNYSIYFDKSEDNTRYYYNFSNEFFEFFNEITTLDLPDFFWTNVSKIQSVNPYTGQKANTAVAGIDINAPEAWEVCKTERSVIVAVIDTGIDYTHEDLKGVIWTNDGEIPNNGIDDDKNGFVDDYYGWNFYHNSNKTFVGSEDSHGTHNAGTIGALKNNIGIAGIADSDAVRIMTVKALGGSNGEGSTKDIIKAIQYAEANGASICNMSFGVTTNDVALEKVIQSSKMLFIAAAGNNGQNTDRYSMYPASYDFDNIISVANITYTGELADSSNYGVQSIDIAAPGTDILSTVPGNAYAYMSGTSMAAPMVTGVAAMLYCNDASLSLQDVRSIILNSASYLPSLKGRVATAGLLDAYSAITYDTSHLSGSDDTSSSIKPVGNAPVITYSLENHGRSNYLTVTTTDADNDLSVLLYQPGLLQIVDFSNGEKGISYNADLHGKCTFSVSGRGTYTFYAKDIQGNETVLQIDLR